MLFVVVYELGPANWVGRVFGTQVRILADIGVFGTVGPVLAFVVLHFVGRWQDERETSDFQSQLLAQARADASAGRRLGDEAMQALFAAGMAISALKSAESGASPEMIAQLEELESGLDRAIRALRAHVQDGGA